MNSASQRPTKKIFGRLTVLVWRYQSLEAAWHRQTPHFPLPTEKHPFSFASESTVMSDFDKRLQNAINRGQKSREEKGNAAGEQKASAEDLRNRHSQLRITLSEHIEGCLKKLTDHFPGFEYSTVMNEDGWGARITRDDINLNAGTNRNLYSRLEMLVKPFSDTHIIEVATKGTIRNKESLNRTNFRFIAEADDTELVGIIDNLVVEFAEKYSAEG